MAPAQSKLLAVNTVMQQNKSSVAAVVAALVLVRVLRKRLAKASLDAREKRRSAFLDTI